MVHHPRWSAAELLPGSVHRIRPVVVGRGRELVELLEDLAGDVLVEQEPAVRRVRLERRDAELLVLSRRLAFDLELPSPHLASQ